VLDGLPEDIAQRGAFILAHLRPAPVPFVPEIVLYQADEPIGLWELTEASFASDCHDGTKPPNCPYPDEPDAC
jgi:predicted nicotinamide N-methyase